MAVVKPLGLGVTAIYLFFTAMLQANLQAKRAQEAKVVAEELLNTSNSANSAALQEAVNRARSRSHSDSRETSGFTGLDATPQHHRASWVDVPTPLPGADAISPVQPTAMDTVFTPESHQNVDHSLDSTLLTPGSPLTNTNELRGLTDRESRQFLIKLEQELIASGTDYSPPKLRSTDPAHQRFQEGGEERGGLDASDSAEMMRFLNMSESNAGGTAGTSLTYLFVAGPVCLFVSAISVHLFVNTCATVELAVALLLMCHDWCAAQARRTLRATRRTSRRPTRRTCGA
jgi:Flp pilus assembly protein TadB